MAHKLKDAAFAHKDSLSASHLDWKMIRDGVNFAYKLLDTVDAQLIVTGSSSIASLVELANLSAMFGNFLASGIAGASKGLFKPNKPHTYPDLVPVSKDIEGIEIKVALESNRPKGHLPKEGYYLTFRYVLGDSAGNYTICTRMDTVWVWEIRFGYLNASTDFSFSSTAGDSGKTAVINTIAFDNMAQIYYDARYDPYKSRRSKLLK